MNRLGRFVSRALPAGSQRSTISREIARSVLRPSILRGNGILLRNNAAFSTQPQPPKLAQKVLEQLDKKEKEIAETSPHIIKRRIIIRNTVLALWLLVTGALLTFILRTYTSKEDLEYPELIRNHILFKFRNYLTNLVWNLRDHDAVDGAYAREVYKQSFWSSPATESKATLGALMARVNTAAATFLSTAIRISHERQEERSLKTKKPNEYAANQPELEEREKFRTEELESVCISLRDAVTALETALGCRQWGGSALMQRTEDAIYHASAADGVQGRTKTSTVDLALGKCFIVQHEREACHKNLVTLSQQRTNINGDIPERHLSELLYPDFSVNPVALAQALHLSDAVTEKCVAKANLNRYTDELKQLDELEYEIRKTLTNRKMITERHIPDSTDTKIPVFVIRPSDYRNTLSSGLSSQDFHVFPDYITVDDNSGTPTSFTVVPAGKVVFAEFLDAWCRLLQLRTTVASKLSHAEKASK